MKKSELKEMIQSAIVAEASEFETNKPERVKSFLRELDDLVEEYHAELYLSDEVFAGIETVKNAAMAALKMNESKKSIKENTDEQSWEEKIGNDIDANTILDIVGKELKFNHVYQDKKLTFAEAVDMLDEYVEFSGMDSSGYDLLIDIVHDGDLNEAKDVDVEEEEDIEVDVEKDVVIDDEETDIEIETSMPGESESEQEVQGLLMKAQEEAAKLGDEKLTDQIGNTITYFTRAHISQVAEGKLNENSPTEIFTDQELDKVLNILTAMYDELGLENNVERSDALYKFIEGFFETLDYTVDEAAGEEGFSLNENKRRKSKTYKLKQKNKSKLTEEVKRFKKLAGIIK